MYPLIFGNPHVGFEVQDSFIGSIGGLENATVRVKDCYLCLFPRP